MYLDTTLAYCWKHADLGYQHNERAIRLRREDGIWREVHCGGTGGYLTFDGAGYCLNPTPGYSVRADMSAVALR